MVDAINKKTGRDYRLNYSPFYGGYYLEFNEGSQNTFGYRLSAKEMLVHLTGILDGLDMR